MRNKIESNLRGASYIILAVSAAAAIWAVTRGLEKPLLGPHSFRQTQTAISAYYMADDPAMFLDYITPVLGPPWRIPMELPVFQWIVARFHQLSGIELDICGKLVSIAAWLLCMVPLASITRSLQLPREVRLLTVAIALSSPLYLFWGAAFLIETTGVLCALCMVASALCARESPSWKWLLIALAAGTIASTVKATTWAVAAGTGLLLVLFYDGIPRLADWKKFVPPIIALLLPLIPGKLWLAYGDSIKQANPFAREIILASSPKQAAWNFGTLEQKLDPETWQIIFRHILEQLLVPFPILGPWFLVIVLAAGAALAPRRIPLLFALLAGFASGPIVFTNLYFEHSYYWCANGIWLLLATGVALGGIWEGTPKPGPKIACLILTIGISASGFITWSQRFLPIINSLPTRDALAEAWTLPIQKMVPEGRTLLIVGNDWNPNSVYYAKRKGLAFPAADWIPFPGAQLDRFFALLNEGETLGGVIISPRLLDDKNQGFWNEFLRDKHISTQGTPTAFGVLFPSSDFHSTGIP